MLLCLEGVIYAVEDLDITVESLQILLDSVAGLIPILTESRHLGLGRNSVMSDTHLKKSSVLSMQERQILYPFHSNSSGIPEKRALKFIFQSFISFLIY